MMNFKGGIYFEHQMQGGTNQEGQIFKYIDQGGYFCAENTFFEKEHLCSFFVSKIFTIIIFFILNVFFFQIVF